MATPYRGYTEVPGSITPDVPYRLNLALREIDADIQDLETATRDSDIEVAGRLAAVEAAAGFGSGMKLQDDAVTALIAGDTKTAGKVRERVETLAPAAVETALEAEGSALRETFDALALGHLADNFHGPMSAWGQALRNRSATPAIWVSLGSSTANGGNSSNFGLSWVGRIAGYLTGKPWASAHTGLDQQPARPANGVLVVNGAQGGTKSADYLNSGRVAGIKKLQPNLITHMVGANDYGQQVSLATYKTNLRNWMDQLQAAAPNAVHLMIHQQGRQQAGGPIPWTDYGKTMAEVAAAYPNVAFLDANERFGWNGSLAPHLVADGLHMNDAGHKIMADLVAEAMGNPIPYVATEYFHDPLTVGGQAPNTVDFVNMTISPAPYPRVFQVQANLYAYGTGNVGATGPDLEFRVTYTDDGSQVGEMLARRLLNGGVGYAMTHAANPTYRLDANREAKLNVRSAGAMYFSNNGAYSELNVTLSPV